MREDGDETSFSIRLREAHSPADADRPNSCSLLNSEVYGMRCGDDGVSLSARLRNGSCSVLGSELYGMGGGEVTSSFIGLRVAHSSDFKDGPVSAHSFASVAASL